MPEKLRRGFASMDLEKRRIIASKGGKAAHEKGRAHEFTSEEAREAGRKGGHVAHEKGTAHRFTSEEARAAGRKGGQRSRAKISPLVQLPEQPLEMSIYSQESEPQWATQTPA
jgi:general stress protein YciG